jgi:hypothetical protein
MRFVRSQNVTPSKALWIYFLQRLSILGREDWEFSRVVDFAALAIA